MLLTKLKVFKGPKHPHAAQKPERAQSRGLIFILWQPQKKHQKSNFSAPAGAKPPSRASASPPAAAKSPSTAARLKIISRWTPCAPPSTQPLTVTGTAEKLDVRVNVSGGGPNGQAGAARHGIARALLKFDANLRPAAEGGGFPHARSAHARAQEIRPARRAQTLPILEALIAPRTFPNPAGPGRRVFYFGRTKMGEGRAELKNRFPEKDFAPFEMEGTDGGGQGTRKPGSGCECVLSEFGEKSERTHVRCHAG